LWQEFFSKKVDGEFLGMGEDLRFEGRDAGVAGEEPPMDADERGWDGRPGFGRE
jgi:hypothetical protein